MPTGPLTCGLKFLLELFAKRRKGGRVVDVKTGENRILFLIYWKALVMSVLLWCVEQSSVG